MRPRFRSSQAALRCGTALALVKGAVASADKEQPQHALREMRSLVNGLRLRCSTMWA